TRCDATPGRRRLRPRRRRPRAHPCRRPDPQRRSGDAARRLRRLLLGGASPAEAAAIQLLVLAGLIAAETVAATLTAYHLAPWLGPVQPTVTDH
ncbi:MAG: hypothetical protein JWQ43_3661, partial [Glaciihabitans sp.]|nr:hypothetical protein [Glaciihabitans sp.]